MIARRLAPVLLLAACGAAADREVGVQLDHGDFGNATMQNSLVMQGEMDVVVALTRQFAAEVDNTVTFAFDSDRLDARAQATLARQAEWIRRFPSVRFRVYGHTDLVGSGAYNQALGLRRAQAVVAYLSGQGISRARLEAVVSHGETKPLVYTEAPSEANRRTVTEVIGFAGGGRPMLINGKYIEVVHQGYIASAAPASDVQISTGAGADPAAAASN